MSNFSEASTHVTRKQSLHVPQEVVMREFCSSTQNRPFCSKNQSTNIILNRKGLPFQYSPIDSLYITYDQAFFFFTNGEEEKKNTNFTSCLLQLTCQQPRSLMSCYKSKTIGFCLKFMRPVAGTCTKCNVHVDFPGKGISKLKCL